jgi:hypothetical protein
MLDSASSYLLTTIVDPIILLFFIAIIVLVLMGWGWERRITKNYFKELSDWIRLKDNISGHSIPISERGSILVEKFFLITSRTSTELLIANVQGKSVLNSPIEYCLPKRPSSSNRFFPALLTSIGVLGTFLGITAGLSEFDMSGNSSAMIASASSLLNGMKSAFVTSILGLFSGASFMMLLWHQQEKRKDKYDETYKDLELSFTSVSLTSIMYGMNTESQKEAIEQQLMAAQTMAQSNQLLAKTVGNLNASLSSFNADHISTSISEALKGTIIEVLHPPLAQIPESLSKLEELPELIKQLKETKEENHQQLIEFLMIKIKDDVVSPVMEQTQQVAKATEQTATAVGLLSDNINVVIERLGSTTDTLNEFQKNTMTRLEEFAGSLQSILGDFQSSTETSLTRIMSSIEDAMGIATEGMKAQRLAFEESAAQAAESFRSQNEVLKGVGVEATNLMNDAKASLLDGLGSLDGKIKSMSDGVQDALERFRLEYQANLESFFKQQESILEDTLGGQRDGLIGVVDRFKVTFEEENTRRSDQLHRIVEVNDALMNSVDTVKSLVEAVGMTESAVFDQLDSSARSVSAQIGKLQLSYEGASDSFVSMTNQMPEAMSQYFDKANDHSEKFFENFDDAAFQVHSRLAEAANLLVTSMSEINRHRIENSGSSN